MSSIAAIVLTYNEEKHLERCLRSLQNVCSEVWVVDSFSTDRTAEIAQSMGAHFVQNPWKNYATQFNWALANCPIKAEWIWRVDADEYLTPELGRAALAAVEHCAADVNGFYVKKRIDFLGRPLLHGGWYPSFHLKLWRRGHGECENRWMDEHIHLFDGRAETISVGDQVDANLNDLTWWTDKHNHYATREVIDALLMEHQLDKSSSEVAPRFWGTEEQRKRWLKLRYVKFPLFLRPCLNFLLRYVLKGGFLDGKEGLMWHVLQGFWYRFLVDAKIREVKRRFDFDDARIKAWLEQEYGQ